MKKKPPWALVALTVFIVFCVLPPGIWYANLSMDARKYDAARSEWEQKFAVLVENRATVEEVKQRIRSEGREVIESEAEEIYGHRHSVRTVIPEVTYTGMYKIVLVPIIYFDEEGKAVEYKVE